MSTGTVVHFRAEAAPLGLIAILTPDTIRQLVEAGMTVNVERSTVRCFRDDEYVSAGANLVAPGSWPQAPVDHIIVGTKEMVGLKDIPLKHTHVYSGYYYKEQNGWVDGLARFARGGGTLLDFGWTKHETGSNVDIFGRYTGVTGVAVAIKTWVHQLQHPDGTPLAPLCPYKSSEALLQDSLSDLQTGVALAKRWPRIIITGPRGRCGTGCVESCRRLGIPEAQILQWGRKETSQPGPYHALLESDILLNCIFVDRPIPSLVDVQALQYPRRKLSVIVDVSCDNQSPYNPLPIYSGSSSFENPIIPIAVPLSGPPLSLVAIPYLPALVPRETSAYASKAALPLFRSLIAWKQAATWRKLEKLFHAKMDSIPESTRVTRL